MAACYPPIDRASSQSGAELRLYRTLGEQLGPQFTVLHSVAWIAKPQDGAPRDGETDLLVLHPVLGALVIEVKGGRIELDYRQARWTSTDRHGQEHPIKNPFDQAKVGKYGLLQKLRESQVWQRLQIHRFNIGHAAFFPDIGNGRNLRGPDAPPEIIGDSEDMADLERWVTDALNYWRDTERGGLDELGARGVDHIVSMFARTVSTRALLSARIRSEEARRIELTERQAIVLDMLRRQNRVMIAGGAGTGKTLLAREKAVRLAQEGMRTLLMCFNRGLADHLREQSAGVENLDVASFHQVCHRWLERARKELGEDCLAEARSRHPAADEYHQLMPIALADAIYGLGPSYDAIIVDEAQDFGDEYWMPVEMLLNNVENGLLYVFLDENQDVYSRSGEIPIKGESVVLDRNCRTSAAIHRAAYRHYRGAEVLTSDIEGVPVETVTAGDIDRQAKSISAIVTRLVAEERVAPHHIAVLVCDHGGKLDYERALRKHPFPKAVTLDHLEGYREGSVTVDTVRRFKGLERQVIILWGFDHADPELDRETIYVGMSRATSALYLVGTREACARIVGTGPA
ncbi:UvrD-helicase domain-containing protein [Enterovirga sp. GCM10030262]|uniref:UvrD-helicase domain-containing protein n=1 Tax=Enterovirga sp. GCM10030262 TaxID=3273391 RepID=UPI003605D6D1